MFPVAAEEAVASPSQGFEPREPVFPAAAEAPQVAEPEPVLLEKILAPSTGEVAPEGLAEERDDWVEFAKAEFWQLVEAFDAERAELEAQIAAIELQLEDVTERLDLQEVGLSTAGEHPTATSVAFKEAVGTAVKRRKEMAKRKDAVLGATGWTVNGSVVEGRKMVDQFSKLMLRAYNSELNDLVRSTNATNAATKVKALGKKRDQIRKLGASMNIEISPEYHQLAVYEIETTGSFQQAKMREKEEEREHREQLREQRKIEAEIKREQDKLDKEAGLYLQALEARESDPDVTQEELVELRAKIAEVEAAQADVMVRAANTRAGHVYVISNPGSFGAGVVKIGMTRRLDPMDRVKELGDASVPFRFSVHALIFADDAVELEAELHRRFAEVRINRVNMRREFFRTTPQEVRDALVDMNAHLVEFDETPINEEWDASR